MSICFVENLIFDICYVIGIGILKVVDLWFDVVIELLDCVCEFGLLFKVEFGKFGLLFDGINVVELFELIDDKLVVEVLYVMDLLLVVIFFEVFDFDYVVNILCEFKEFKWEVLLMLLLLEWVMVLCGLLSWLEDCVVVYMVFEMLIVCLNMMVL